MANKNRDPMDFPGRLESGVPRIRARYEVETEGDDIALDLAPYWDMVVRRKWLLLGVLLSILLVTAANMLTTTPLYTSTATIQIDVGDPNILPYQEVLDTGTTSRSARGEDVKTHAKNLHTRSLARRVIKRLNLAEDPIFTKARKRGFIIDWPVALIRVLRGVSEDSLSIHVDAFVERVKVEELRNTRLINVSYESVDPEHAALIVNTIAEEFIESNLEGKFDATRKATDFLQKELETLQFRVEESEEKSLQYARSQSIVSLSERETIARKKLADLSDDVTQSQITLIEKKVRYEAVLNAPSSEFPEMLVDETIRAVEDRLSLAEEEYEALSDRFGPEWPATRDLRQRIQTLTRQVEIEKSRILHKVQQEYKTALKHYQGLSAGLEKQTTVVDRINEDLIQYNIMRREVDTNKQVYESLLQRLKEAGVSGGLRSSNISIADEGVVPRDSSSPNKKLSIAIAILFGLLLGGGAAVLAETLDNSLKSLDDVKRYLGLPALGFVPHLAPMEDLETPRLRNGTRQAPVIAYNESKRFQTRDWEAYRSLRTSILLSHSGNPPQTLLVTSALPSEGKSTTAANIAIALAQGGAHTVLLDLDLRRPVLGKLFGLDNKEGLSNYLSGNSPLLPLVQQTSYEGLFLLTSGPSAPNPPELIASERMTKALEQLSKEFTHIVVDTPPAYQFTDSMVLSPRVDGVILVARSGKTPKEILKKLADRFSSVGAMVLGIVLNDLVITSAEYGYGYYGKYGKYGRYGTEASEPEQDAVELEPDTAASEQEGEVNPEIQRRKASEAGPLIQDPVKPTVMDFATDGSAALEPGLASFESSHPAADAAGRHEGSAVIDRTAKAERGSRAGLWGFVAAAVAFGGIASFFVFGPSFTDETAAPQRTASLAPVPGLTEPAPGPMMDDMNVADAPAEKPVDPPNAPVAVPAAVTETATPEDAPPVAPQTDASAGVVFEPSTEIVDATTAGEGFTPPKSINRVEPTYNADDVLEGGETVVLRVLVNDWGKAVQVDVEKGRAGSPLVNAAIDAALNTRYSPAEDHGRQVRAWTTETFVFSE